MNIPTLDRCPGYSLYIGGFIALRRPQALKNANITHIVSVLDWRFDDDVPLIRGYQHLHIPVDDVEDENLLEWFPRSNAFIQAGLDYWRSDKADQSNAATTQSSESSNKSGVLIHCAMGKSRSATILLAYLLWSSRQRASSNVLPHQTADDPDMVSLAAKPLTVIEALERLRRGRPIAEPNEGFMDQLHMYEAMGCPTTEIELKKHKTYRRWMNKRSVDESLRVNMAPEMAFIKFEDESDSDVEGDNDDSSPTASGAARSNQETRNEGKVKGKGVATVASGIKAPDGTSDRTTGSSPSNQQSPQITLKCRKCRHVLATTPFILPHIPPPHTDPAFQAQNLDENQVVGSPSSKCAHVFLHPLSWMRPVLSEGQMEGRLGCPKCNTNIGKFAWTGLRCSCGGWVTPGFAVTRGKVDEVAQSRTPGGVSGGGSAVRLPPGMRRGGGNL